MKKLWLILISISFFPESMFFLKATDSEANTLLLEAAKCDNLDGVKTAIAAGAHVNAIVEAHGEFKGFTPLHLAAFNDCGAVAEELCKHPDIHINTLVKSNGKYKGYTPLHLASIRGYASAIKALIKHKNIDINGAIECDGKYKGFVPLHLAIFKGYRFAVIELLQHKDIAVNATIENDGEYDGLTPLKLAESRDYLRIAEELLKHKDILENREIKGSFNQNKIQKLRNTRMGTSGFWGIIKNGEEKMIFSQFDSYPEGLGKEVVCLIQNNLESLEDIFDKIIFVKNINNLDGSEAEFILMEPETLISEDIKEKYFSESAKKYFEYGGLEYGYMIDLDKSVLKLYKDVAIISEINLDKIKYKDVAQAFRNLRK